MSVLGVSAGYLLTCEKNGVRPAANYKLAALRSVNSTGSPLPESGFRWVHENVSSTVPVVSVSGGTDIASAFVGGAPWLPVRVGEIPAPCLGAAVAAWNEAGQPVVEQVGELVITEPMPSMPLRFLRVTRAGSPALPTRPQARAAAQAGSSSSFATTRSEMSARVRSSAGVT